MTPDADGTLVRLVDRGIPEPNRDGSAAGWTHYLARLVLAAAGTDPGLIPGRIGTTTTNTRRKR